MRETKNSVVTPSRKISNQASPASSTPSPAAVQVVGVPTIEIRPAGGSFFVKSESPSFWSQPSTWISVIALTISLLGFAVTIWDKWWGFKKDLRSREQSIQDEFWLRKVLFPTAIEPVMTFATDVMAQLPAGTATESERLAYFTSFQDEHRDHARKLVLVATIWPAVYKILASAFEEIEDAVADYCQLPDSPTGNATGRTVATDTLNASLGKFYVAIRDHQNAIGKKVKVSR